MKRIVPLLFLLLVVVLPINTGGGSFYNGISGLMFCNSQGGCLHEIGHMMDDDLGGVSRSSAFADAVRVYLYTQMQLGELNDLTSAILGQPGVFQYSDDFHIWGVERFSSPQEELYANIYQWTGGDVSRLPNALRPFYSADDKYTNLQSCLMSARVRACGKALHIERK